MTDKNQTNQCQSIPPFLTVLILLLTVAVGIQFWYMAEMKQTLNTMQGDQASLKSPDQQTPEAKAKSDTENSVDSSDTETALNQDQPSAQGAASDEKNITSDDPALLIPPARADDDFFNSPPYMQAWDPQEEIMRMQRHMERVFNERYYNPYYDPYYNGPHNRPDYRYRFQQNLSTPKMEMRENQNQYMIMVNLPGADQKDISVNLEGQRLTITGKQQYKKQDRDPSGQIIFSERRSGKFKRGITLPAPVEKRGMKTKIDNGVLRIIIPKKK